MSFISTTRHRDLYVPEWFWLVFPPALYFGHYLARAVLSDGVFDRFVLHETGFTEQFTIMVGFAALLVGLAVVRRMLARGDRYLVLFFGVFCLGCLYFTGEEASWGQHCFGWATPAEWDGLNNQGETNLHNSSGLAGSLLDQLPRNLLAVAALIGGGILPLVRRYRGRHSSPGTRSYWIMPGLACVPAGFIAALASIPEKISKAVAGDVVWPLDINGGEVKELMIAVFLLVYIGAVWIRLRHAGEITTGQAR